MSRPGWLEGGDDDPAVSVAELDELLAPMWEMLGDLQWRVMLCESALGIIAPRLREQLDIIMTRRFIVLYGRKNADEDDAGTGDLPDENCNPS